MNFNYYGAYSLYLRETKRFLKVYNQTLLAPGINALIFLTIFKLALGEYKADIGGISFMTFMGTGLVIMSITQNAFANTSSSMVMMKVLGYITDILMPPLSSRAIIIALSCGALTRGVLVGIVVSIFLVPFVNFGLHSILLLCYFVITASLLMAMLGILTGIATNTFDQNASVNSYVITPLSFLSGTFYSVEKLPDVLQMINIINPFYYIIDGFRFSLTGVAMTNINHGIIFLLASNILLFLFLTYLFDKGWRIKS